MDLITSAPLGIVAYRSVEDMARAVCDEWRLIDPAEVEAWKRYVKRLRDTLRDPKGMSQMRELMALACLPSYVDLKMTRLLGDPGWKQNDPKALAAVLAVIPEARLNTTSGVDCDGNK